MQKSFSLFLIVLFLASCNKVRDNIIWERYFGEGEAYSVNPAGDTGIVCSGTVSGKPYLVFLDMNHNKHFEYNPDITGSFTSAIAGNESVIAAGSTEGKLLIVSVDFNGSAAWDTILSFSFSIEKVSLCKKDENTFLAVGSRDSDSISAGNYGVTFLSFSEKGEILAQEESLFYSFFAVSDAATDNSGNLLLALTRIGSEGRMKALVAKYDERLTKIWEQELYNNPEFSASSLAITPDNDGNVFISGYTEFPAASGAKRNSFVASVNSSGMVRWKKYLEYSNAGTSLLFDRSGRFFVLNRECLILNLINPEDGSINGILRTYASCDPSYDRASGNCLTMGYENILIIGGKKNGSFYIAAKSPDVLSPV